MELAHARIGPYVRAIAAGLHALAPHDDWVPLAEATAHLAALDPDLSGALLLPAEVDDRSGMPAFAWMQRARSEQVLAREAAPLDADAVERAEALDPDLATRLRHRRALRAHLRHADLLPAMRIDVAARRLGDRPAVTLAWDTLDPFSTWVRVRIEVEGSGPDLGAVQVTGAVPQVSPGLGDLLARHVATPLLALRARLDGAFTGTITRLAISRIGPFWFPGVSLPDGVSAQLGRGLLLHASSAVVAADIRRPVHRDPLAPPDDGPLPPDQQVFRERRFAATTRVRDAVERWCRARGVQCEVVVPRARLTPR